MKTQKLFQLLLLLPLAACLDVKKGPLVYSETKSVNHAVLADLNAYLKSKNCQSCHAGWFSNSNELVGKLTPGNPDTSKIYQRLKDGTMPKDAPAFTNAELEIVRQYIVALSANPVKPLEGYALVKATFFDSKCVRCHKGLKDEATIPKKWLVSGNPEASLLYTKVASDEMPMWYPKATTTELQLMSDYIHGLNQSDPQVRFQQLHDSFLKPKCLKCHAWAGIEAEVATRIVPGESHLSKLYNFTASEKMPVYYPKATAEEKQMLYDYIKNLKVPATTN